MPTLTCSGRGLWLMEGGRHSCSSPNASSLGQTQRTEVRTPGSTCSQWRSIFRVSCLRASQTPMDNLLLETWFTVTSKGLTLTVASGGGGKTKTKLPLTWLQHGSICYSVRVQFWCNFFGNKGSLKGFLCSCREGFFLCPVGPSIHVL